MQYSINFRNSLLRVFLTIPFIHLNFFGFLNLALVEKLNIQIIDFWWHMIALAKGWRSLRGSPLLQNKNR